MVELIFVVVVHVYIEQCTDMLNLLKVNYKGHRATFSEVSLVVLLNVNMFITWIWFSVAGRRKFGCLIFRRSHSHLLKCCSVKLKAALQKLVGLIIAVTYTITAYVLYCIQQWLTCLHLY